MQQQKKKKIRSDPESDPELDPEPDPKHWLHGRGAENNQETFYLYGKTRTVEGIDKIQFVSIQKI